MLFRSNRCLAVVFHSVARDISQNRASDTGLMRSLEVTELNPILDIENQSGEVAVDVITSAFGKRSL